MHKYHFRRIMSLLAVFAFLVLYMSGVSAAVYAEEQPVTVRIGVYESNGFIALNEKDEMNGYGKSFMESLAQYANIKYEYVRLTWSECMHELLTGGIDIVTDARHTPQRDGLYEFSVQNIGQIQAAVFVPDSRDDIYLNDYEAMDGLRVGFETDAMNKVLFERFAEQHNFKAVTSEYPSTSDLRRALANGEIDAFGGDTHVYTDDLRVISIYNTEPNYIMAKKGSKIMERINIAIEEMFSRNPEIISEQYSYIADRQLYGEILLTRAEAEYREAHPKLRVATYTDRKPASWYDEKTQSFNGIAIEMMERLSEITGIEFEYVPAGDVSYASEMLESGVIDLAIPVVDARYYDGGVPVRITRPLYTLSAAMAVTDKSRDITEDGFTVAVAKSNSGIMRMISEKFANVRFNCYDTAEDCIKALKAGKVDAYGNAMYELEYRLRSPKNEKLKIVYSYNCPVDYCVALNNDAPDELLNILNDGIALISSDEIERITRYHVTFSKYEYTVSDHLYANRYPLIISIAVVVVLTVGWVLYYKMQKRALRSVQKKEAEARLAAESAARANSAKSEFLSRMSHDMRTPMNGILGLAKLSEDMEMSPEAHETVQKIISSGQFLLSLINDTLDMSKIESNQLVLKKQPVDSYMALMETLDLIRDYASDKNVKCTLRQENVNHRIILIDKLRVQQIILNILSNAVKFSPDGGEVELYLECCDRSDSSVRIKFVITDHGIGISPEFLPKIFEPFEQEHNPSTSGYTGTGLGMSIAKHLIDIMGGRIEIESVPNEGTAVTLYFDFEVCDEKSVPVGSLHSARTDILKNKRMLLCEDNNINTIVAKGILEKAGCIVDCAENGIEGVKLFSESAEGWYSAVLMDIHMPLMDGIEATKTIRALNRADAKTIPVIALTANAFDEDKERCLDAGMNAHVAKPIDTDSMFAVLIETIGGSQSNT